MFCFKKVTIMWSVLRWIKALTSMALIPRIHHLIFAASFRVLDLHASIWKFWEVLDEFILGFRLSVGLGHLCVVNFVYGCSTAVGDDLRRGGGVEVKMKFVWIFRPRGKHDSRDFWQTEPFFSFSLLFVGPAFWIGPICCLYHKFTHYTPVSLSFILFSFSFIF